MGLYGSPELNEKDRIQNQQSYTSYPQQQQQSPPPQQLYCPYYQQQLRQQPPAEKRHGCLLSVIVFLSAFIGFILGIFYATHR